MLTCQASGQRFKNFTFNTYASTRDICYDHRDLWQALDSAMGIARSRFRRYGGMIGGKLTRDLPYMRLSLRKRRKPVGAALLQSGGFNRIFPNFPHVSQVSWACQNKPLNPAFSLEIPLFSLSQLSRANLPPSPSHPPPPEQYTVVYSPPSSKTPSSSH